jgi:hypothetical protein
MPIVPPYGRKIGDLVAFKRDDWNDATGHIVIWAGDVGIITKDGDTIRERDGSIGANGFDVWERSMMFLKKEKFIDPVTRRVGE